MFFFAIKEVGWAKHRKEGYDHDDPDEDANHPEKATIPLVILKLGPKNQGR